MSLHLNLYHEIERQKLQRRRDPLKLGMLALLMVAAAFAGYYFYRMGDVNRVKSAAAGLKTQWATLEKQKETATKRQKELEAIIERSNKLMARVEGRFYWGPVLEEVLISVPPEVQLTKLEAQIVAGRKRQISMNLHGVSAGDEPRTVAENFRTALDETLANRHVIVKTSFNSLEDGSAAVRLDGQDYRTANFSINISVNDEARPAPDGASSTEPRVARLAATGEEAK